VFFGHSDGRCKSDLPSHALTASDEYVETAIARETQTLRIQATLY
jgi:hypothetical protein